MSQGYETHSVGNMVNNNIVPVYGELTRFITMIILKRIEISNHYAVLCCTDMRVGL